MATTLPNGPLQVVFSFDTTGSMFSALTEVRGRISDMLQRLQSDIPGITTAVVAHGDYCDADETYLTDHIDFSNNLPQMIDFVNNVGVTSGGDTPEAYEVMLRLVRKTLTWQPGSQRVLVVIGDAYPHPPGGQNKDRIDWKEETTLLAGMGVRIYGVQVHSDPQSTAFFRTMADRTGGQHLKLADFSTLCDVIMAICYREKGVDFLQNWETEVRARQNRMSLHRDLDGVFGTLRRAESSAASPGDSADVSTDIKPAKAPATLAKKVTCTPKKKFLKSVVSVKSAGKIKRRGSRNGRSRSFGKKSNSKPKYRKLIREKVPDTNFRFNNLKWSPWKLAVLPSGCEVTSGDWQTFLGGVAHIRTGPLVRGYRKRPGAVMVEVAVQTRPGGRRHVMWGRVLPCSSNRQVSVSRCLMGRALRLQLDKVVRSACRVWVRGALLTRRQPAADVRRQLVSVYDYAWGSQKDGCTREVWVPNGKPSHRIQIAGAAS